MAAVYGGLPAADSQYLALAAGAAPLETLQAAAAAALQPTPAPQAPAALLTNVQAGGAAAAAAAAGAPLPPAALLQMQLQAAAASGAGGYPAMMMPLAGGHPGFGAVAGQLPVYGTPHHLGAAASGMPPGSASSSLAPGADLLYVNQKQLACILRRRRKRQQMEAENKRLRVRKVTQLRGGAPHPPTTPVGTRGVWLPCHAVSLPCHHCMHTPDPQNSASGWKNTTSRTAPCAAQPYISKARHDFAVGRARDSTGKFLRCAAGAAGTAVLLQALLLLPTQLLLPPPPVLLLGSTGKCQSAPTALQFHVALGSAAAGSGGGVCLAARRNHQNPMFDPA